MKPAYRADIDGLRAIAVLAVVFNHAGFSAFSGGYIGVDIFFVISGFLITSIIAREIEAGEFTLAKFYERRVRRILPALTAMAVFALAASVMLYDSGRLKSFAKSLFATMLFYSNINFWGEAGYFDAPSSLKPLLHTWSLAVEEQFYIVYPLFLYAVYRWARRYVKPILVLSGLASLGFAVSAVSAGNATSAFYLSHLRAWELLVGGLLALNLFPVIRQNKVNAFLGFAGVLMTLFPVLFYTDQTPFPGLAAIPPVLGTALIIYSGGAGRFPVGAALGSPAAVFVGQISYSLYLWHWPLFIFANYYLIRPLNQLETFLLLAVVFLISILSWRFVETPFRSRSFLSARQAFSLGFGALVVLAAAAGAVYRFDGFPQREGGTPLADYLDKEATNHYTDCAGVTEGVKPCLIGDKSQPASFILWGDSHAESLRRPVERAARNNGAAGYFTYKLSCPPLFGVAEDFHAVTQSCAEYNDGVFRYLSLHPEISTVILAARWSFYIEGEYQPPQTTKPLLAGFFPAALQNASYERMVERGLEETVASLLKMKRRVVIVSPVPEIGYDVPSANFIAVRSGRDLNEIIAPSVDEYLARNRKAFAVLDALRDKYDIQVVDPWKALCVDNQCRVAIDGLPVYKDDDHLSLFGSELTTVVFEPIFDGLPQP
ncbi:MAG: acyltransferase [Chloroflexi bacterium]|nr:acyltransferase [Chloroflexota bacterium]